MGGVNPLPGTSTGHTVGGFHAIGIPLWPTGLPHEVSYCASKRYATQWTPEGGAQLRGSTSRHTKGRGFQKITPQAFGINDPANSTRTRRCCQQSHWSAAGMYIVPYKCDQKAKNVLQAGQRGQKYRKSCALFWCCKEDRYRRARIHTAQPLPPPFHGNAHPVNSYKLSMSTATFIKTRPYTQHLDPLHRDTLSSSPANNFNHVPIAATKAQGCSLLDSHQENPPDKL